MLFEWNVSGHMLSNCWSEPQPVKHIWACPEWTMGKEGIIVNKYSIEGKGNKVYF